jgi:hypothetical protein
MYTISSLSYLAKLVIDLNIPEIQPEPLSRDESGRFGALKSDSTHHFFRNQGINC